MSDSTTHHREGVGSPHSATWNEVRLSTAVAPPRRRSHNVATAAKGGLTLGIVALPLLGSTPDVVRAGFVLCFAVGAIALHVLVNWTGQLSLAHAAFIGVPALVLAYVSKHLEISPLVALPIGVAVGAGLGVVVGVPSLRVRGLYVTIATLCFGIAVERYFLTQDWVARRPLAVAHLDVGPLRFASIGSKYLLMAVLFLVVLAGVSALNRSRLYRALLLVRSNPRVAVTVGVDASLYRFIAYGLSGALAGLAGGMYAIWIQRLSSTTFPLAIGFTFLTAVTLAGPGSLTGVVIAAIGVAGLNQFVATTNPIWAYGSPLLLIFSITRYPDGINGSLRDAAVKLRQLRDKRRAVVGNRTSL